MWDNLTKINTYPQILNQIYLVGDCKHLEMSKVVTLKILKSVVSKDIVRSQRRHANGVSVEVDCLAYRSMTDSSLCASFGCILNIINFC